MYIRMYPMCKCYKITPKAFIYQKTKNAPLSEDDNEWKKKKFVAQRTRFFNTRWIYENVDLFGTGAGVYIKTKYHEKTKKKKLENKSLTGYLYTEKNVTTMPIRESLIGFPLGQHHDMNLKKSDFSCLGIVSFARYILLSAMNTNINYCVHTFGAIK